MAYNPTPWKDRAVANPRTYTLQNNSDGTVTLIPAPGVVHEAGTPVNAVNLNKIEQGIAAAITSEGGTFNGNAVFNLGSGLKGWNGAERNIAHVDATNTVRYGDALCYADIAAYEDKVTINGLYEAWHTGKLRINNGMLEFWTGTEWRPVGNVQVGKLRKVSAAVPEGGSWTTVVSISGVGGRVERVLGLYGSSPMMRITLDGKQEVISLHDPGGTSGNSFWLGADLSLAGANSQARTTEPIYFYNSMLIEVQGGGYDEGEWDGTTGFVEYRLAIGTP